jgi:hypothetical protein
MLTLKAMDEIHRVSPESIQGEGLMKLCLRDLPSRSKYGFQRRFCQREEGHSGRCDEFPFKSFAGGDADFQDRAQRPRGGTLGHFEK